VAVTETWLSNNVYDSELFPENFLVFKNRNRESKKRGGGVLLAVKNVYKCKMVQLELNNPEFDIVLVKVYTSKNNHLYILVVYITPNCTVTDREELFRLLETLEFFYNSDFIVLGDLNITHLRDYYLNQNTIDYNVELFLGFFKFL